MEGKSFGIIEGFYGRQWSWGQREGFASFLKAHNYQTYIYAPKGDVYLRSQWRMRWPADIFSSLKQLSDTYKRHGVKFGIGISPMGLLEKYAATDARDPKQKISEINALAPDVLCILFDDMHGAVPQLSQKQLSIVEDVISVSTATQHIVCPTYYSFDPVLEQLFGVMPDDYLQSLGDGLPNDVGVFWTGDKVISEQLSCESIKAVTTQLGRKPIIWDNIFANDGRNTADFLPLHAHKKRTNELLDCVAGVVVNPMNQAAIAALMLPVYYAALTGEVCKVDVAQKPIASLLARDAKLFSTVGLAKISPEHRGQLIAEYQKLSHPAAIDVVEWLQGGYCFDPACLTG